MMHDVERKRQTGGGNDVNEREDIGDGDRRGNDGDGGWVERREGPSVKLIVVGVLCVLLVVFLLQNAETTKIAFLFLDGTYPLWSLLVVVASSAVRRTIANGLRPALRSLVSARACLVSTRTGRRRPR